MTNQEAIKWLNMYASKPVRWDNYSDDTKTIREKAEVYIQEAFNMAINALKLQEPRVMTLEEVLATEVVYVEDVHKADIIPVLVDRRVHDRIVLVRARLMGGPSLTIYPLISDYGKYWRCWTSRPTEAQRKAVKWE